MTDPAPLDAAPDPDDLDGHTFVELTDYVDRGRTPADPSIEASPGCRRVIASLERLRRASASLETSDAAATPADDAWIAGVMEHVVEEARAGADFVLARSPEGDEVLMTEGALRAVVRAAGDGEEGFLVGRVRFEGDLSAPPGPLTVTLQVVASYGVVLRAGAEVLRTAVRDALERHTAFRRPRIDVVVQDVLARGRRP